MIAASHVGDHCDGVTSTGSLGGCRNDGSASGEVAGGTESCGRYSASLTTACPRLWHRHRGSIRLYGRGNPTIVDVASLPILQSIDTIDKIDAVAIACVEVARNNRAVGTIGEEDICRKAVLKEVSPRRKSCVEDYVPNTLQSSRMVRVNSQQHWSLKMSATYTLHSS